MTGGSYNELLISKRYEDRLKKRTNEESRNERREEEHTRHKMQTTGDSDVSSV